MGPAVRTAVAAVLAWYAGLAFAPVFGDFPGPGPFLLAVSVAVLAALSPLVAVRRLGPLWTALAGSVAVTVAGLVVTGAGLDVVHGPWRLLTMALPADASGPVLAAVAIAAGWGALAADVARRVLQWTAGAADRSRGGAGLRARALGLGRTAARLVRRRPRPAPGHPLPGGAALAGGRRRWRWWPCPWWWPPCSARPRPVSVPAPRPTPAPWSPRRCSPAAGSARCSATWRCATAPSR